MARNNPRNWPCEDCKAPKTATRPGSRCPTCAKAHATAASRRRLQRLRKDADAMDRIRARARRRMAAKRLAAKRGAPPVREPHAAVLLYRAEKEKRDARNAAELSAAMATAKALLERAA